MASIVIQEKVNLYISKLHSI